MQEKRNGNGFDMVGGVVVAGCRLGESLWVCCRRLRSGNCVCRHFARVGESNNG